MVDLTAFLAEVTDAPPCGSNLEHDLSFFELEEAARYKPEQRLGEAVKPAEDPNWPRVAELASALLVRTKDLRVAVYLTRALTRTDGVPGLAMGLGLIRGLVERYWDHVHPMLEAEQGGDPTERLNALAALGDPDGMIRDLRDASLVNSREHGQLQARQIEIALGRLAAPRTAAGTPKSLAEIHAQIAAAFAADRTVPASLAGAREHIHAIQVLVSDRVGADRGIDLKPLAQPVESLLEACDAALGTVRGTTPAGPGAVEDASNGAPAVRSSVPQEIGTREDALRVLDLVCAYLECHEPSNPAPLFIRRAQRLMTKNFLEIVKDLMPDSLSNLEKLAGEVIEKKK